MLTTNFDFNEQSHSVHWKDDLGGLCRMVECDSALVDVDVASDFFFDLLDANIRVFEEPCSVENKTLYPHG